ncbi:hypothetical protein SAMN05444340_11814 [Citreimonas salinaria]|uniref:Tetratricopeptide repeat-containing protein n=2 Tax=Citreimonas salinaria TaxID=321339 RepID=A0A1H3MQP8_9RHOB|nr:hypothetical protein SAMN05444340_11814 [Citreimonas salinaria]
MTMRALALVAALVAAPFAAPADEPTREDLLALQFYASNDDTRAVEAELERLRAAFPAWSPPSDLDTLFRRDADLGRLIDGIYADIALGRFDAARAGIANAQTHFPEWPVPDEMTTLLRVSEAQHAMDAAEAAGDRTAVIAIAAREPGLLTCARVNNAWILAEAYAESGRRDEARDIHAAIVERCDDKALLIATLEKADPLLTEDGLADLTERAITRAPADRAAFEALEARLLAGRGADGGADGDAPPRLAAASGGARAPARSLRPVLRNDARAVSAQAAPRLAETPSRPQPARASGAASATVSDELTRAVRSASWQQCLRLTQGQRAPAILAQRGWCAYNAERPLEALDAFRNAYGQMSGAEERRDTGYGILLAMLKLGQNDLVARDAANMPLTYEQRVEVEGQILDRRGVAAYEAGDYDRAIAFILEHQRVTGKTRRDLEMIRGYSLLKLGQRQEARAIFEQLHAQLATQETAAALRAAR